MHKARFYLLAFGLSMLITAASAQLFNFTTLAGSAGVGSLDGTSTNAQFNTPGGMAMDTAGNVYVADTANDTIRKITATGTVSTLAGMAGVSGSTDGSGTNALFHSPQGIAVDGSGNVYVADTGNFTIREITPSGVVSTLAGSPGISGTADGANGSARFYEPEGVAVDGSGNLYVADTWNQTIRKITIGSVNTVTTVAGAAGVSGSLDGTGTNAFFNEPQGLTINIAGNIFVTDAGNNTIRQIIPSGTTSQVSTLAGAVGVSGSVDGSGTNAVFNAPSGISADTAGNVWVADALNNTIRKITLAGAVTTMAGTAGNFGTADGTNGGALFRGPQGIVVNPTNANLIYVADTGNSTVRQLSLLGTNWVSSTFAGTASIGSANLSGAAARFFWQTGVAVDGSGNVYVADTRNNIIRKITVADVATTLAGNPGISGSADGSGTNALFNLPQGVAVDTAGNVYVTDTGNGTIRKITSGGAVTTLAGSAGNIGSADGANGTAQFFQPTGIAVDGSGNVFVADTWNHTVRTITPGGVVKTLAGVANVSGSTDGTNSAALFNSPAGIAVDASDTVYITDTACHTIREVTSNGVSSTLAGLPQVFGNADGTNNAARFFEPAGIVFAGPGNLYVADGGNQTIRELTLNGNIWTVSTVAGWPGNSGSADGSGMAARFNYPAGLAIDTLGKLYVADAGNNTIRIGSSITNNPPTITSQPQNASVDQGNAATFSVSASGAGTLYYQWQFNGVSIPGATGSSYTLASVQSTNAGNYSALVSTPTGSVLSSNAVLTVYAPPVITSQPASQICLQGTTITFSVVAGTPPLTYQWEFNGTPLASSANVSGTTTTTLTISNTTAANSGSYSVVVSNAHGNVASTAATLTVFPVPIADSVQPYAWWQLNEGTGTVAFDYSGNGHVGTLNGGATWTAAGHAGTGVYFNATSTAKIPINNPFILSSDWSAVLWVNRWGTDSSSVLMGGTHDALKLEQYAQTNHVGFTQYSVADYALGYATTVGSWTHLAFVKNSAGISLYANGVLVATTGSSVSLDVTTLGCDDLTDYLDATLDDVRIYNQALTSAQVSNLYTYDRITPLPVVTLTAPTNNQTYPLPTTVNLAATVVTNGQSINAVQFYAGTNLLGQATVAPYTWTWTNVLPGNYSLTAAVIFSSTNMVSSAVVNISVTPATNRPSITLQSTNGGWQLSWPLDHTGWRLQAQTNSTAVGLTTNWSNVNGATTTNQILIQPVLTNGSVFFRMIYP